MERRGTLFCLVLIIMLMPNCCEVDIPKPYGLSGKPVLCVEQNVFWAAALKFPEEFDAQGNRKTEWRRLNCGDCHSSNRDINDWMNHWTMAEQKNMRNNLYGGVSRTQPPHVFYLKPWELWDKECNNIPFND